MNTMSAMQRKRVTNHSLVNKAGRRYEGGDGEREGRGRGEREGR